MTSLIPIILIPILMIIFGVIFINFTPKEINSIYGYRTPMSKKNKDTWNFAHKYCGRIWLILGIALLIVSTLAAFFTNNSGSNNFDMLGSILIVIQVVFIVGTIFPTEAALKKNFDKDGKRRF